MIPEQQRRMYGVEQAELGEAREQAVLTELNRLLDSAAFRTSRRCREFLKYVVEHTIKGPRGTLTERAIGVELFQLPEDFDTGQHTIVRVTANEVRKKLAQHYLAENGTFHPVRINLPPGSYAAEFKWETRAVEPPAAETPVADTSVADTPVVEARVAGTQFVEAPAVEAAIEEREPPARPNWLKHRLLAGTLAALFVVTALAAWRWRAENPTSVNAKSPVVSLPMASAAAPTEIFRVVSGADAPYVDRSGRAWGPDRFF